MPCNRNRITYSVHPVSRLWFEGRVESALPTLLIALVLSAAQLTGGIYAARAQAVPVAAPPAAQPPAEVSTGADAGMTAAATHLYTLDECLTGALHDPSLVKRHAIATDRARTEVSLAKTNLGPTYSSVGILKLKSDRNLSDTSGDQLTFVGERVRLGITVSYPLYDGGALKTSVQIAELASTNTQNEQISENNSVTVQTVDAYYNVLQGQRMLESVNRRLNEAQAHLTDVTTRLQVGTVTRGDQLEAQSAVDSATAEISRRQYTLASAQSRLALLMNLDPVRDRPAVAAPAAATFNAPAGGLVETAISHSSEYDRLKTERLIAEKQLVLIRERRRPTITGLAGVGFADRSSLSNTGSNTTKPYVFVGLNATLPLFETVAQRAREREQRDNIALSQLRVDDYKDEISSSVTLSQQGYQAALVTIAAATQAVTAAEEARRLAAERYAVGKATQYEVLSAMDRLESARDALAEAEGDRDKLAITLRVLTGNQIVKSIPGVTINPVFPIAKPVMIGTTAVTGPGSDR